MLTSNEKKNSRKRNQFTHSSQEMLIDIFDFDINIIYRYGRYLSLSMAATNNLVASDQINHSICGENSLVVRKIQLGHFSSE